MESTQRTTAQLRRMESTDRQLGGVHLTTPSGIQLAASWRSGVPVQDTLATAKGLAAQFVQHLIEKHEGRDVGDVNWVSVVAACQRHVADWNDVLRKELYSTGAAVAGERGLH